jgi:hypothetical protein
MDISHLVTQDNADNGVWTMVELYGREQDFELRILGNDSDAVQKFNREQVRKMRSNTRKELSDEIIDSAFELSIEGVLVRISGIRGLKFDEKHKEFLEYVPVVIKYEDKETGEEKERELKNDKESYQFLIEKIPALKEFVLKISGDRTNFLSGKPSG